MIRIDYPARKPHIKAVHSKEVIFCIIRKRWILLTPEEWVRQNILIFLTDTMHYPSSLIAVEKQLLLDDSLKKRFDIVVFKDSIPFMVIECKEMNVELDQRSLDQVMRYNRRLDAAYFFVTNGTTCYGFEKKNGSISAADGFPSYQ